MVLYELFDDSHRSEIIDRFTSAGYHPAGEGMDAMVFVKDDSHVAKIIIPHDPFDLGPSVRAFMTFYNFCQQNPSRHLPEFSELNEVEVDGEDFVQIIMEKLYHIPEGGIEEAMIWLLSDAASKNLSWIRTLDTMFDLRTWQDYPGPGRADDTLMSVQNISQSELRDYGELYKLMRVLHKTAREQKLGWDLHTNNVMQRSDGTLVITDPWFSQAVAESLKQGVAEAFDKPYKGKWEKSEFGDQDMNVKLPDGTNLSIMFNHEGDDEWTVEFWRNNSQDVTGEGDQQRIFSTVLNAIQKFIKKQKPERIRFSANKDVDPGQKSMSRTNLYNKLVKRYANSWGYNVDIDDFADTTVYNLHTMYEGVAEGTLNEFAPSDGDDDRDYEFEVYQCNTQDHYDVIGGPVYQTDDLSKAHYIAQNLHKKYPNKAFMIWQPDTEGSPAQYGLLRRGKKGVAENFADGKKPGRRGLAKRMGVDCKQSVSKLRSIAASSSGERQRMAHWCANMKSGKKK